MPRRSHPLLATTFLYLTLQGAATAASGDQPAPLDGTVYDGIFRELGADSGGDSDRLVFRDGQFVSEACLDYGFAETSYSAFQSADGVHFTATSTSPSHGVMVWRGLQRGERMDAEITWTKERWYWTTHREYRFQGILIDPDQSQ
jgi:hypothetical protein